MVNHLFLPPVHVSFFFTISLLAGASGQADTSPPCFDTDGWLDSDGDDCSSYHEAACVFADSFTNDDGVSALDACCECGGGGGGTTSPPLPSSSPTLAPTSLSSASPTPPLVQCYVCDGEPDRIVDHNKTTTFDGEELSCLHLQSLGIYGVDSTATCEFWQLLASQDCGCSAGPTDCTDSAGWVDNANDDCSFYEWHGCELAESNANAAGVSAFDACCICGGGIPEGGTPTTPSPTGKTTAAPEGDNGINPAVYALAAASLVSLLGLIIYCQRKRSASNHKESGASKFMADVEEAPPSPTAVDAAGPTAKDHQKNSLSLSVPESARPEDGNLHHSNDTSQPPVSSPERREMHGTKPGFVGKSGPQVTYLPTTKDQCRSVAAGGTADLEIIVDAYPVASPVDMHESPSHSGASSSSTRRAALDP